MHHFQYANLVFLVILPILCKSDAKGESSMIDRWDNEMFGWFWNRGCPPPHTLHPCTCQNSRKVLECEDIFNEDDFKTITEASTGYGVIGIELQNVAMRYIGENVFNGLELKFLSIKNSGIYALSDTAQAFIGLEKSLEKLTVENTFYLSHWEWSHLANLTKLHELNVTNSVVLEIGPEFMDLAKLPLTAVQFVGTQIRRFPEGVFSSFKDLKKLLLDRNDLFRVNRTMFPRPAKKLETLGLGHNHLRFLPKDIFADMPALKNLYLGGNHLYVLDEDTYKPVWSHLKMLVFSNIQVICDCRLKWIIEMKNKGKWIINFRNKGKFIHATCTTPSRLKGREITTLELEELWCQTTFT